MRTNGAKQEQERLRKFEDRNRERLDDLMAKVGRKIQDALKELRNGEDKGIESEFDPVDEEGEE